MSREPEKRQKERLPAHGQLHGEVMVYQPMTIVDISYGGAQLETPFPLQLDSLHQFRISLGDLSVVIRARIAHCRIGDLRNDVAVYRSGVEFVEPSDHARNAIAWVVDTLRASRTARGTIVDGEVIEGPEKA
jgi:hypothetical protein